MVDKGLPVAQRASSDLIVIRMPGGLGSCEAHSYSSSYQRELALRNFAYLDVTNSLVSLTLLG